MTYDLTSVVIHPPQLCRIIRECRILLSCCVQRCTSFDVQLVLPMLCAFQESRGLQFFSFLRGIRWLAKGDLPRSYPLYNSVLLQMVHLVNILVRSNQFRWSPVLLTKLRNLLLKRVTCALSESVLSVQDIATSGGLIFSIIEIHIYHGAII